MKAITDAPGPWWKRIAWFVAIWTISVATLAVIAYGLRLWI